MHPELSEEQATAAHDIVGTRTLTGDGAWWRDAAVYQVYVRSFADANGDGTGDLAGVRSRLPYLAALGIDALWFTPWYLSPLADGGYDVSDYRRIDPSFGDLADAEALIREASALGIRTIVDVVPNHVSTEHAWFRAALADPDAPERELFWFRAGRDGGDTRPTDWTSSFGGDTWSRTTDPDGTAGDWYLHLFAPEQPDLNWNHPAVHREHEEVLRFWFDRGVAGIRVDSAAFLAKDAALPVTIHADEPHPHLDRDEVHDVYREWRRVADSYDEARMLVGEVWLADDARFARYLRSDELHSAFNFDFMIQPWDAAALRSSIERTLTAHADLDAEPTWALSNHDVTRPATRYGRAESAFSFDTKQFGTATDPTIGLRRARAAALLVGALPGSLYVYQGDELGLPEVEDLPLDALRDPMHARSGGADPGRDGCRVPLPWRSESPTFGFSTPPAAASAAAASADPWLPQPATWSALAVDRQDADPDSTLALYRAMLALRRIEPDLTGTVAARLEWVHEAAGHGADALIAFRRGSILCLVNLGTASVAFPPHRGVLLGSAPLEGEELPPDTAAWLRI